MQRNQGFISSCETYSRLKRFLNLDNYWSGLGDWAVRRGLFNKPRWTTDVFGVDWPLDIHRAALMRARIVLLNLDYCT